MKVFLNILAFVVIVSGMAQANEIVLVSDEWCPFNCEIGSDRPGYMVEIARKIFENEGHTVTYAVIPWARAVKDSRRGKYTGIIAPYKEDAPDFIFPEEELAMIGFEIFVKKDSSWRYSGIMSLSTIYLGVMNNYAYSKEIDAYIQENKHKPGRVYIASGETPLATSMNMLLYDRIDAVLENPSVFWYTATKMGNRDHFKSAGVAVPPRKAYIAFSPSIPESRIYAQILSKGIVKLRKSGELAAILDAYGLRDWKPSAPK